MLSICSFLLSNSTDNFSSVRLIRMSSYISHPELTATLIHFIKLISLLIYIFINCFSLSNLLILAWWSNCCKTAYMTPYSTCELTFLSVFYISYKLYLFSMFLNKFLCTSLLIILTVIAVFFLYAFILITSQVLFTMSYIYFSYKICLVSSNQYS